MNIVERNPVIDLCKNHLKLVKPYFDDPLVTEIMINSPEVVFIERAGQMERIDGAIAKLKLHKHQLIAFPPGSQINDANKLVSTHQSIGWNFRNVIDQGKTFHFDSKPRKSAKKSQLHLANLRFAGDEFGHLGANNGRDFSRRKHEPNRYTNHHNPNKYNRRKCDSKTFKHFLHRLLFYKRIRFTKAIFIL